MCLFLYLSLYLSNSTFVYLSIYLSIYLCPIKASITLTLMTGILGVLVKSTLVPSDRMQTFLALCIATFAVLSTFMYVTYNKINNIIDEHDVCVCLFKYINSPLVLVHVVLFSQSLTKQLNLGGRAGFHESASTALVSIHIPLRVAFYL